MAASNETIHHRPISKFRLPPPIDKDGYAAGDRANRGSKRQSSSLPLPPPRFNVKDSGNFPKPSGNINSVNELNRNGAISSATVLPGRPRRRPHPQTVEACNEARNNHSSDNATTKEHSAASQYNLPVPMAVLLWYLLGVVSISSSKILLSTYEVPPMLLTLQQLIIGITLLRSLLMLGKRDNLQPVPMESFSLVVEGCSSGDICEIGLKNPSHGSEVSGTGIISAVLAIVSRKLSGGKDNNKMPHINTQLLLSSIYFALGFLFTNYGFQSGSAAFVETIKAAEPITSASVAVAWGIERLGKEEVLSLVGIVLGVLLSTFGQHTSNIDVKNQSTSSSLMALLIVMISNLCFSFRGLHQKLFRASPQGKPSSVDDLNLQLRMQQIGVLLLVVPAVGGNALWVLGRPSLFDMNASMQYVIIALANGIAFTSYNLASTYVLTRISVVHHAALNCIRRVFAVIVTSVVFGLPTTTLQVIGIATSVGGFFSFSHHKMKKSIKENRRKALRRKYGVPSSKKSSKWDERGSWTDEKKDSDSAV